mmetsp:Transcript_82442/g.163602  ORF Transcript_82442/g.163602 Transcript_82442/m.163602 type:complete len:80 (+) Transcript_82442:114-353(+)
MRCSIVAWYDNMLTVAYHPSTSGQLTRNCWFQTLSKLVGHPLVIALSNQLPLVQEQQLLTLQHSSIAALGTEIASGSHL